MIDAIRKAVLAGVGAAAITTERAEKVLNELVEKGKLSASDAREAARKIADDGKHEIESATKDLEARLDSLMAKFGRGGTERIDKMESRIGLLEARVAELERVDLDKPGSGAQ